MHFSHLGIRLSLGSAMPIYILKRYHNVTPADASVWHLKREVAFHAMSDHKAIALAQKLGVADLKPRGGIAILFNPDGRRLWETQFDPTIAREGYAGRQHGLNDYRAES